MESYVQVLALLLASSVYFWSLHGFFSTKTKGFGKYTTSALLLMLVSFAATIGLVLGKTDLHPLTNLLFAIAGYAGGLVSPNERKPNENTDSASANDARCPVTK